jgi:sarcosine reductase
MQEVATSMPERHVAPPLEIATYRVEELEDAEATRFAGGQLHVNLDSLGTSGSDPALAAVKVDIARPDESTRVTNVLDAVLPDVKVDHPDRTFPGALGGLAIAGRGRTNRLAGVAVLSVCDWAAAGFTVPGDFPDALVDMAGPGAALTRWGQMMNVVVSCVPAAGAPVGDVDRAVRQASLRVARDLAGTTIGQAPTEVETIRRSPLADPDLPAIGVVLQVASEGPLAKTFLYGREVGGIDPTLLQGTELLDGALTNGAYDWAAIRNLTANYQDSSLVRSLLAADGERLRFAGLILALGYLDTAFEKQRSAMLSACLAESLGADGVICTTFSGGNSHTDTMLTVRACESLGIRTTAIVSETNGGLVDHVAEADCIVSVGNEDELIPAWTPDTVIGAARPVQLGKDMPLRAYVGACTQTGDMSLMSVSV